MVYHIMGGRYVHMVYHIMGGRYVHMVYHIMGMYIWCTT